MEFDCKVVRKQKRLTTSGVGYAALDEMKCIRGKAAIFASNFHVGYTDRKII